MDRGLHLLHAAVAGWLDDGGRDIMQTALYCMTEAIPLDPATWAELIAPFRSHWLELLRDLVAELWPDPEPRPLAVLPWLSPELAELWKAFDETTRNDILEALNGGDPEAGRRLLNDLVFSPPQMTGLPPQEVVRRISDLGHVLWPVSEAQPPVETLYDDRD